MEFMKKSVLIHPLTGTRIETPLLLPSFSSKLNGKSDLEKIFNYSKEFIAQSYLVSAFDIYNNYLPKIEDFPCPEFIFVDSGGYEISDYQDLAATSYEHPRESRESNDWDVDKLKMVYDRWPEEKSAVFISFDHPKYRINVEAQIKEAKALLNNYHNQLKLFLLKPETNDQRTLRDALKSLPAFVGELCTFDIIGVTEKELGASILERMLAIAKLRTLLTENKILAPIHVFGALDPLTVCLYFMAGAEIFDGLTWIRYAYQNQMCIYISNHGALNMGIHCKDDPIKGRTLTNNYYEIENLQLNLNKFLFDKDYNVFGHGAFLKESYTTFESKIGG